MAGAPLVSFRRSGNNNEKNFVYILFLLCWKILSGFQVYYTVILNLLHIEIEKVITLNNFVSNLFLNISQVKMKIQMLSEPPMQQMCCWTCTCYAWLLKKKRFQKRF